MGLCASDQLNPEQIESNRIAERLIRERKQQISREVKILVLGKKKKKKIAIF